MSTVFPEQFNLADYLLYERLAEGLGESPAIRFGDRRYSYRDVADRSTAVARFLLDAGVRPEERVLTILPDVPPFAWALFGTLRAGAVVAMGNPAAPAENIDYLIEYTGATAVITTPMVAQSVIDSLTANPRLRVLLMVPDVSTGEDPEGPVAMPDLDDSGAQVLPLSEAVTLGAKSDTRWQPTHRDSICMWLFTSGSTGHPKAAMHCHRDFAFNTKVYAVGTIGYRQDDVTVSVPRLYFGYATGTNLFFPFAVGATTALFSERPTPESLARAVEMYRPTAVTNVPTMMGKLLDHDARDRDSGGPGIDMSCVRFHLSAGEALPPALLERFTERFGGEVYDGIGSAEMFHIYCSNRPGDVMPGSLGRRVEGYELKVLPREASGPGAEEVADGEIGVLWVRGDSVSLGYYQDRDTSWQTFHGHWCRTGDLFRRDKDGYFWFCGRDDDLFKVSGIWVSPIEVETCLMTHESISIAAVVAQEEEGLTKPKAFVVLKPGVSATESLVGELQEHCKSRLSVHKYPRWVEFVSDLPKNDRGKIDRRALAAKGSGQ